jgi:hypothetical protein
MKSILDPTFRYVPSTQTDIRKTFARVRREMAKTNEPRTAVVVPLTPDVRTVRVPRNKT